MSSHQLPQRPPRVSPETLHRWRAAGFHTDEKIGYLLEDGARKWPERIAVISERGTTTFGELARRSHHIACALVTSGVQPGDAVSWMLPTGTDAIATAAAIWRIGAVSSPLVPLYGKREITAALDQVRPAAIITAGENARRSLPDEFDEACQDVDHALTGRLLTDGSHPGWSSIDAKSSTSLPDRVIPAAAHQPGLVLFTSGTESGPKGAIHSVAGLTHELRSTITEWGITFRDRMVMASPMTHITGLLQGFMIPAKVGAAAVLLDRWDPELCVELIETHGATYMAGATPFLRELKAAYQSSGRSESSLVQYCCGGASVPPELIRSVQELGISAYRAWGMTELPTATLANELDPLNARAETDGRLAPGVELAVLDPNGRPVPSGDIGELFLQGPEMMMGYVVDELDTAAFTADGWLRTGDMGRLDEHGRLQVTGRIKDIINRGGEKFSAREIEEAVGSHPDISAVAVTAVPGGRLGERVGAAVVSSRTDLTIEEIGQCVLRAGLARQKQPEIISVVSALPTNATGKIDRRALVGLLTDTTSLNR